MKELNRTGIKAKPVWNFLLLVTLFTMAGCRSNGQDDSNPNGQQSSASPVPPSAAGNAPQPSQNDGAEAIQTYLAALRAQWQRYEQSSLASYPDRQSLNDALKRTQDQIDQIRSQSSSPEEALEQVKALRDDPNGIAATLRRQDTDQENTLRGVAQSVFDIPRPTGSDQLIGALRNHFERFPAMLDSQTVRTGDLGREYRLSVQSINRAMDSLARSGGTSATPFDESGLALPSSRMTRVELDGLINQARQMLERLKQQGNGSGGAGESGFQDVGG